MAHLNRRRFLQSGSAAVAGLYGVNFGQPLCASKEEADPYADAVFRAGPPPALEPGGFTIAVLPDTQNYSEKFPEQYFAQTRWIIEQRQARQIACVLHLGDITNNNAPNEWDVASRAMRMLDGHVPYFMVPGNHDYSAGGRCVDRKTRFNDYFPLPNYRERPEFGGVYDREPDRLENSYHLFTAGGRNFLVLCLEFGPRADVVRWAREIAAQFHDRAAILVTHAYLYSDDTRYDWAAQGAEQRWNPHSYAVATNGGNDVCDGQELWRDLVAPSGNFILTLNGHVLNDGLAHLSTAAPDGREIPQVLVNFQMKPQGGDGWIRLLEFRADGQTVEAYDYSPTRDQCNDSPQNRFTISIPA